MIFYRSPVAQGGGLSLSTLRILITVALLAYPAGCLVLMVGDHANGQLPLERLIGFGLITLALFSAAPIMGSRLQRIVGEEPGKLDEMELQQRHKATSAAYMTFTAAILLAIFYAGAASEAEWWVPAGYEFWNALFWGVLLYATLLPTAFLAWTMPEERD